MGRFINADALVSTGQGMLGYNMFSYCLNNPIRYADYLGQASRDKITSPLIVVVIIEDGNGNGAGGGGGGVSPTLLLIGMLSELVHHLLSSPPDTDNDEAEPVYYGIDLYNGTWNYITGPMNFQEASNWAKEIAASGIYSNRASWGLYTENREDAEAMAVHLGMSYNYTHDPAIKGHKPHYHTAGRLICGIPASTFHVWYEE